VRSGVGRRVAQFGRGCSRCRYRGQRGRAGVDSWATLYGCRCVGWRGSRRGMEWVACWVGRCMTVGL